MRKKWFVVALIFIVCLVGIQAPSAFAKDMKKISLIYADHIPAMAGGNIWAKKNYYTMLKEECAKLGYELDITFYQAGSLYKSTEMVGACERGLIDMAPCVLPYEQARFPLHELLDFGFMGWNEKTMYKVWADLYKTIPEFRNEMEKHFFEMYRFTPSRKWIHTNMGAAVRTPAGFKGKKIHTSGLGSELMKNIGAVPIRQNPGDWYTSLDRGLFDGIVVAFDMVGIMKLWEVLDTHIEAYNDTFGYTPVTHLFNRRKFKSLPEVVQQLFVNHFEPATIGVTEFEESNVPFYQKGAKEKGHNFVMLTADETAQWRKGARAVHKMWIAEKEKKGIPAQKMYDEALRLAEKYNQ